MSQNQNGISSRFSRQTQAKHCPIELPPSLIGCGLVQKRYAFPNISKKSYTTVKYGVKTLASFMDCIIFLYLGIVTIKHTKEWHTGFVLWTIVLCTAVRLARHKEMRPSVLRDFV